MGFELAVRGVVWRNGEVLLVRMTYGPLKGQWVAPGGLVNPDETVLEAAAREVLEESGVVMAPTGVLAIRHYVSASQNNLLTLVAGDFVERRAQAGWARNRRSCILLTLRGAGTPQPLSGRSPRHHAFGRFGASASATQRGESALPVPAAREP